MNFEILALKRPFKTYYTSLNFPFYHSQLCLKYLNDCLTKWFSLFFLFPSLFCKCCCFLTALRCVCLLQLMILWRLLLLDWLMIMNNHNDDFKIMKLIHFSYYCDSIWIVLVLLLFVSCLEIIMSAYLELYGGGGVGI